MIAFSVAKFRGHDHHIQRRQLFLELEPKQPTAPRRIKTLRVLDHQSFVQTQARALEFSLDFVS